LALQKIENPHWDLKPYFFTPEGKKLIKETGLEPELTAFQLKELISIPNCSNFPLCSKPNDAKNRSIGISSDFCGRYWTKLVSRCIGIGTNRLPHDFLVKSSESRIDSLSVGLRMRNGHSRLIQTAIAENVYSFLSKA